MSVLVAGGAGYIGSVTVEQLLAAGREVVVLDNLSRGHAAAVHPQAALVRGDCGDADLVRQTIELHNVEAVMHFCALSLVGESVEAPISYYRNNLSASINLVESCIQCEVRAFIFSSTAAVYGEPERVPIDEDAPTRPANPYGRSKLYFERFLEDCDRAYGFKSMRLRYFNAAGASERCGEDHRPETHLIPLVLQAALGRRSQVAIFGGDYDTPDGSCVRDFIHVADLARAHLLALKRLEQHGRSACYNLGNGKGFSVREVIQCAEQVTGKKIPVELSPRRPGDPARLVASAEKIRTELGWSPKIPGLDQIIADALSWMTRNPNGYKIVDSG